MKITIEHDDRKKEVFQDVTDYYLSVRQLKPVMNKKMDQAVMPETRSFSRGDNVRELVKELTQSLVELQNIVDQPRQEEMVARLLKEYLKKE